MVDLTLGQVVEWWRRALGVRVVQYAIVFGVVACVAVIGVASAVPEDLLRTVALFVVAALGGALLVGAVVGYRAYKRL